MGTSLRSTYEYQLAAPLWVKGIKLQKWKSLCQKIEIHGQIYHELLEWNCQWYAASPVVLSHTVHLPGMSFMVGRIISWHEQSITNLFQQKHLQHDNLGALTLSLTSVWLINNTDMIYNWLYMHNQSGCDVHWLVAHCNILRWILTHNAWKQHSTLYLCVVLVFTSSAHSSFPISSEDGGSSPCRHNKILLMFMFFLLDGWRSLIGKT